MIADGDGEAEDATLGLETGTEEGGELEEDDTGADGLAF
jgi:hypothetical protein